MKIGFLSVYNFETTIGGIESHIYFLSKQLHKRGHEVIIYTPVEIEDFKQEAKNMEGVMIKYVPLRTPKIFRHLKKYHGGKMLGFLIAYLNKAKYALHRNTIANFIQKDRCDLVHQHDFISNVFTTNALSGDMTCVLTNHTGEYLFLKRHLVGRMILKYLLKHYRLVIGPSRELTPVEFVRNSVTIPNGVDLDIFCVDANFDKNQLREAHNISPDDFVIFCPMRWAPTKGIIYFLEAIENGGFDDKFTFVFSGNDYDGYPKYKERCLNLYESIENKESVVLLGNLSIKQMAAYYQMSDVVVIPSLMEAVSLSALESMACGIPVISTNVGGMKELITDGEDGLLISPKDSDSIREAINRLFSDKDLYMQIAPNSSITAKKYSWNRVVRETERAYEISLNNNSR
jgi:glycosyltransferase involved in cell wall biosynthesis